MPHSTPQLVPQTAQLRRARLWPLFWLIPIGILAGVLSGALMNGFNGWLSPLYFQRLPFVNSYIIWSEYWLEVVEHGMTEGAVLGVIFSVIYAVVVILVSRGDCPLRIAFRGLLRTMGFLGLTSLMCGLNAVLLFLITPIWWAKVTDPPPSLIPIAAPSDILKFYYVWGSSWGIYVGGIFAVIIGCIWFSFDWRNYQRKIRRE